MMTEWFWWAHESIGLAGLFILQGLMSALTEERGCYKRHGTLPPGQKPSGWLLPIIMLPLLLSLLLVSSALLCHAAPVLEVSLCYTLSPASAIFWGSSLEIGGKKYKLGGKIRLVVFVVVWQDWEWQGDYLGLVRGRSWLVRETFWPVEPSTCCSQVPTCASMTRLQRTPLWGRYSSAFLWRFQLKSNITSLNIT